MRSQVPGRPLPRLRGPQSLTPEEELAATSTMDSGPASPTWRLADVPGSREQWVGGEDRGSEQEKGCSGLSSCPAISSCIHGGVHRRSSLLCHDTNINLNSPPPHPLSVSPLLLLSPSQLTDWQTHWPGAVLESTIYFSRHFSFHYSMLVDITTR